MIDPLVLLDDMLNGLDGLESPSVPGFGASVPGAVPGFDEAQPIDKISVSRCSRISRSGNEGPGKNDYEASLEIASSPEKVARTSYYVQASGTPGTPGTEVKSPAESTLPQFPVKGLEPGTPGTETPPCGHPFLDLNSAKPQRSDWWTGDLMAEVDRLAPPSDPLPIAPAEVWAGVERETLALADLGLDDDEARRRAIEITVAKIRNSEALAERQVHGGQCHVCDGPLDDSAPVVAVMTGKRGAQLSLHSACHAAYSARRVALVDRIMASAGFERAITMEDGAGR